MFSKRQFYAVYGLTLWGISSSVFAATAASGVSVTHCTTNCGKVLIGAARIDMASIQWQGADSSGVLLALYGAKSSDSLGNRFFGFTGSFNSNGTPDASLIDYTGSASNKWFFVSTGEVSIGEPATGSKAPKLGFYFSPAEAKVYDSSSSYMGSCSGYSCQQGYSAENVVLKGEGISDSKTNPAFTLDVTVNGSTATQQDIAVSNYGVAKFLITPKLNASLIPPDVQPAKYAQVIVKIDEKGTSCTDLNGLTSFSETQEEPNDFSATTYYHHLVPESANQRKCSRTFSYLVSVDRPFSFNASNMQATGNGYVQYSFYINGHYNPFSPIESEYPNSHKTFRLRSSSTSTPSANSTLTIKIVGSGTVDNNTLGIHCATTSCTAAIAVNTPVTLIATPTTTAFSGWSGDCNGTSTTANVTLNTDKTCIATFTGVTSPPTTTSSTASPLEAISTRGYIGSQPSQYMYAGIKVGKTTKVMMRGLGKGLVAQGVTEALDNAKLTVRKADGTTVDSNDNWQQHPSVNELPQHQRPSDPSDAAMIVTLTEGFYTIELSSTSGGVGIGLVEIYEVK